jgi:hypothetical protein
MVTKPVTVGFASGSAELTKRAQKTVDTEMVPFIENNGKAYFEVSGNSDCDRCARGQSAPVGGARAGGGGLSGHAMGVPARAFQDRRQRPRSSAVRRSQRRQRRAVDRGLPGAEPDDAGSRVRRPLSRMARVHERILEPLRAARWPRSAAAARRRLGAGGAAAVEPAAAPDWSVRPNCRHPGRWSRRCRI